MLGDKHRVATHGRLLAVVCGLRGCKAFSDKIGGMLVNGFGAFVPAVLSFLIA